MTEISTGKGHQAGWYEIRLKGHLDTRWASWFDGLGRRCSTACSEGRENL